jgi:hypothetical protein
MSGEATTPPVVLDEQTRALIESLIQSGVQTALAAQAANSSRAHAAADDPTIGQVTGGDTGAGAPAIAAGDGGGRGGGATADDAQEGDDSDDRDPQPDRGGGDSGPGGSSGDGGGGDSDLDGETENSDQAFTVPWYEARRGEEIAPRFEIPDRFDPRYPIGFAAESIAHYRTFCVGGASPGRESEAKALYMNAAYLTEVSNALAQTVRRFKALESRVPSFTP